MLPKVTIVIPIYKTGKYIARCAESVFNQDFEDLEIIFVNDATPDDSMEVLADVMSRYSLRASQTIIINNEYNLGLGKTRRKGFLAAKGAYIISLDSDDYVDNDMISKLYDAAITNNSDIVTCDFYITYNDKEIYAKQNYSDNLKDNLINLMKGDIHGSLCNKLIRRTLFDNTDNLPSGEINMLEDVYVSFRLFSIVTKLTYVNDAFLHYVQYNDNSYTKAYNKKNVEDIIQFMDSTEHFFIKNNPHNINIDYLRIMFLSNKLHMFLYPDFISFFEKYKPEVNTFKYLLQLKSSLINKFIFAFCLIRMYSVSFFLFRTGNKIKALF